MRKLIYYGNPILRKKAQLITEITDDIRQLVDEMFQILRQHRGIGLAAPQVAESLRLFVTLLGEEQSDGTEVEPKPMVYINPELSSPSDEMDVMNEGCLSIPGLRVPVVRPIQITITATDLEGNRFSEHLSGLPARCRMHENDHLNGVLTIDRVKGRERTLLEPKLREIKKLYR